MLSQHVDMPGEEDEDAEGVEGEEGEAEEQSVEVEATSQKSEE